MDKLKAEDIARVKGLGFLRNRGTNLFSGRMVGNGTVFTDQNFADMAYIAKNFGNGKLIPTSRQAVEIPDIPFDRISEVIEYAESKGLYFGGTGNKIRPVTACKGTTCVYGNFDTQKLAQKIHSEFYNGWSSVQLPHKFKIAVGGCPNSCMKPSLNDFGIEGRKAPVFESVACRGCKICTIEKSCPMNAAEVIDGKLKIDTDICIKCGVCIGKCPFAAVKNESETMYQIYIGGTWGKRTRMGTPLSRLVGEDEVMPLLEKTLLWFKKNAYSKERLGLAVERLGAEKLEKDIFSDTLLEHKEEILKAEVLQRS